MNFSQAYSTTGHSGLHRVLLIVFGIAVVIRLLNLATLPTDPATLLQEDASLYWAGAAVFVDHGSFSIVTEKGLIPHTERVPGYMLFLAAVRAVFGDSLFAALIVQSLIDGLTCVLTAWMAAQLSPRLVLPTGMLAALWPNLIIHSGTILSDSQFLFLFTVMLASACRFLQDGAPRWAAAAGLALGLAILTRPVAQLLPVLMVPAAFLLPLRHGRGLGAATLATILFLACALAPLLPLLHRNYDRSDALALTSQSGAHLLGWVAPLVRRAADGTPREIGATELRTEALERLGAKGRNLDEMNDFEQSRILALIGLEAIGRYPISAIIKAWLNGAAINLGAPAVAIDVRVRALPHPSFDATQASSLPQQVTNFLTQASAAYLLIMGGGIALSLIALGLQAYGVVGLARAAPWAAVFALLCIGYFLALNGPVGSPKYRLPFEPVLIILTALALLNIADRFKKHGP